MLCLDDKDQNVLHRACQVKHGLPGIKYFAVDEDVSQQEGHWPIVEEIMRSVENGEERSKLIEAKDSDGNYPALLATHAGGARGLQIFFGWREGRKFFFIYFSTFFYRDGSFFIIYFLLFL